MSRLEEIKSKWKERDINVLSHMDWLINRVEELEKERDEWKDTGQSYYVTNQELRERNKRYKQALELVLDGGMLGESEAQTILKALEGESNE